LELVVGINGEQGMEKELGKEHKDRIEDMIEE
jgi:hypothetical protein